MDIGEKVSLLRTQYSDGNNLKFAELMEESPGTTSNWCKAKSLGREVLVKILSKLPDVDANWLLMDSGSMLKSGIDNAHVYIDPHKLEQLLTVNKTENRNDIAKRLQKIIQISKLSNQQFAEYIGVKVGVLSAILSGDRPIENNIYEKICSAFNINENWLLSGNGSMSKSTEESRKPEEQMASTPTLRNTVNYKLVPLLNIDAVGGMHSVNSEVGDSEYMDKLIPFTDAQNGDVALMVSGESMSPTCPAGSKVLIREVPKWNEYFGYGNLFVLLLTDGRRILKEVQKWQEDPKNFVLCRSHNDKYPEEELPKSMIAGVWKVIKILNERGW